MSHHYGETIYLIRSLPMGGAVLHIGAHPDDEDIGMMAYLARKVGVRVVYWTATRGEGGQNRIGPYLGTALGVYRTWESLASRAIAGGESLFGPFIDFGFSKEAEEPLERWGHENVVREIVRGIRLVQPQIVIARWTGNQTDGHGHHKAIAIATIEAFHAAGDQSRFPELLVQGYPVWQPQKLYQSTTGDWQPGEDMELGVRQEKFEQPGHVSINTGEFDPIAGKTFQEQAWLAFNSNQSQAIGFVPEPGDFYYYYRLHTSLVSVPDWEETLYDGLDPTLCGLTDYPANGQINLRYALTKVKEHVANALNSFKAYSFQESASPLLEGLGILRKLLRDLPELVTDNNVQQALEKYIARKIKDFETAVAFCLGLRLECLSDDARITPGQVFHLTTRLWNHQNIALDEVKFSPKLPNEWEVKVTQLDNENPHEAHYTVTVSKNAELSCPYWLREPSTLYQYVFPNGEPASFPFDPPLVAMTCNIVLGSHKLTLHAPAVLREGFGGGVRELPIAVIPPISLYLAKQREVLHVSESDQQLTLPLVVRSNMEHSGIEGILSLEAPVGWLVHPQKVELSLGKVGDARTLTFSVIIPKNIPANDYNLHFVVSVAGRNYDLILEPIRVGALGLPYLPDEFTCIKEAFITSHAVIKAQVMNVRFIPNMKYAYVTGASDNILTALSSFRLDVSNLSDEDLNFVNLHQFDTVIIGPNAYLVRSELRKNAKRFLDYVHQGGTLIVQYQGYGFQDQGFTPYSFRFNQPHDRVTYEDAPVTVLVPDHPILDFPNTLTSEDWNGWVIDRGLYFFGEWDDRYLPILSCNDPGEEPKRGGMLVTSYGRGTYVYAAYAFFRQLPAGVPGAFRLFANLLSLSHIRINKRIEILNQVPIFASMDVEQLKMFASLLFDRSVKDGEYLVKQGEQKDEIYIIADGEVEVIRDRNDKASSYIKAGEAVSVLEVLSRMPYQYTLQAKGNVHTLTISGEDIRNFMRSHPEMYEHFLKVIVEKINTY